MSLPEGTMSTSPRDSTTAGVDQVMKFRVAREVLADAVVWTARSLPPRPSVPVLAGILLEVDGSQLSVSGFDYEVSARAEVDVQSSEAGRGPGARPVVGAITPAPPPPPGGISPGGPPPGTTRGHTPVHPPAPPGGD